ncbi:C39 family peptidase [Secundilactobacillus paracollinoides]|uniref:C39 family peptidase n=1 Tax=Secundilactobacillus paracollinoides TaxID=240427 RepID=UPI0007050C50|nr:C39 family peptidase [Secundilactobacillus paracollinoides]
MQKPKKRNWLILALAALTLVITTFGATPKAQAATSYYQVANLKKVDYYTKVGANTTHNYGIYTSGGYKTSAANVTAIAHGRDYAGKFIHVTRTETTAQGTWVRFLYNHKQVGWMGVNGTDKTYYRAMAPLIGQRPELPTGCEITATTMMLQFAGANVTKLSLAKEMPRSSDPNKGFVGSPYSTSGWYIYPGGLMALVKKHAGSAINMTGDSLTKVKAQVRKNHLVVLWVANLDGFSNHAVCVTGYSSTRIYYNDPWLVKRTSMTNANMTSHRKGDAYRALSY